MPNVNRWNKQTKRFEDAPVKVGDYVGFKSDIEQGGTVVAIEGDYLVIENANGFRGEYIHGQTRTREHARDCWID